VSSYSRHNRYARAHASLRRVNTSATAQNLQALLLAYAENELLPFEGALAWLPRKLQNATRNGRRTSLFLLESWCTSRFFLWRAAHLGISRGCSPGGRHSAGRKSTTRRHACWRADSGLGCWLCCQPDSCSCRLDLMKRTTVAVDRCVDSLVGAAIDIPQDL
jgi:hypothetical protein